MLRSVGLLSQYYYRSHFPYHELVFTCQRRKKLSNALKALSAGELLAELGLADLRAEQVGVADYLRIADELTH